MKCYASDYCQKDKSSCSDVCGGYRVLRALYNLSRIPERYRYTIALKPENGEDLEAFTVLDNYKNDVLSMVDEGRGLYIWGKSTGNGKTSWACKIMSYFFRKIAFNTGLENEGLYIFLPTFLEDLRDNYDNKDPEFDEILRMIKTCRLLIIDDIGAERVTDWVRERMVSIINTRVSNNLTTIYTSNLSPEELRSELELAKVLEVPPTTVNGWMRGAHLPDIEKLMEICDYLEMPVGEMLGDHRHINDLDEVKHLMDVSLKQKAYIENLEAELNECKMLNNQLMSDLDADEGLAEICVNEFIADTIKAVKDAGVKKITVEF